NSYKKCRNKCTSMLRQHKYTSERNILDRIKEAPKLLFKLVRSKRTVKTIPHPVIIPETGKLTTDLKQSATIMAMHYSKVQQPKQSPSVLEKVKTSNANIGIQELTFSESTVDFLLRKIDPGTSEGPDMIHPRVLKECHTTLAPLYTKLFQLSFDAGIVPSAWKVAKISPIHKGGDKSDPSNFRPVSLTSVPCKIMEKIIRKYIMDFGLKNKLFHTAQHGFLPQRSCLTNLITFLDSITKATDEGKTVYSIYLDLSKAFDVLPHIKILQSLEEFGVGGKLLNWIKEFLTDRSFAVQIGPDKSPEVPVTSGVPQGSVLGPLLFTIFVNGLPDSVDQHCTMFADDIKLWSIDDPIKLQENIDRCSAWLTKRGININPDKSGVIIYGLFRDVFISDCQFTIILIYNYS
uniref:Reverse transcriptase domain-containing protein n=1 Tax=Oryzias sinensis TaxID=183150 RepID=A0A8C7X067_9TELE